MSASLTIDLSGIQTLIDRLKNPESRIALKKIPETKAILGLVSQAISDNFAKEGPGWKKLQAKTIRASVKGKKLKKELSNMTDLEIYQHERRVKENPEGDERAYRKILQKTGLLKKTVTVANGQHNINKNENGTLVWGTDLIYAGIHNYGEPSKNVPQREFLVIRPEWEVKIFQKVLNMTVQIIIADNL